MGQISQRQHPINLNPRKDVSNFHTHIHSKNHSIWMKEEAIARTKTMSEDRYVNEADVTRCKQQLLEMRASTSNHVMDEKPSKNLRASWRRKAEIKQLEGRLRVLEEEVRMLKGALFEGVEERTKMMHEIHEDFKTIQHCLLQKEIERGKLYTCRLQIVSLCKDKKAGLLHILCQESSPSLVNRGLREQRFKS